MKKIIKNVAIAVVIGGFTVDGSYYKNVSLENNAVTYVGS